MHTVARRHNLLHVGPRGREESRGEMKISGVMIGTEDAQRLGEFYTKVLGEPNFRDGDWWGWENGASIMIGNHSEVHGPSAEPERLMLALEVDDVAAAFADLSSIGAVEIATPYKPMEDQDNWLATLADPDGNFFQLMSPWQG
jgi:predicted enzyme related to lactoylglutathione lyase